ncbi:LacI family transcriptional regulator [Rhizobium sp. Leaf384]|nr:LacI family transcriptional regulator [Rhizobium sp. Leaf384]
MYDIAAAVGVSQATVSLVMNNAPTTRISAVTREKVMQAARELGYEKVHRPQGGIIGMLINGLLSSQHSASLIEGARSEAAETDHLLVAIPTFGDPDTEDAAIEYLGGRPMVGIIYARVITQAIDLPKRLQAIPTVFLNCYPAKGHVASVVPADVAGGFTATSALLGAGHRRIAMINGEEWIEAGRDREKGYREALTTYDIAVDPVLIRSGGWTMQSGREQMEALLDLAEPPTAVFCYCDRMALGVYDAIKARKLRVPEDISVVGFDDEVFAKDMDPPLTTINLPHEAMGRWAVSTLLDGAASPAVAVKHRKIKMECELVVRGSIRNTGFDTGRKSGT